MEAWVTLFTSTDTCGERTRRASSRSVWLLLLAGLFCMVPGCRVFSHTENAEGVRQFQQGQYQSAITHFQRAIADNPRNADGYYNLASTYHRMGKVNNRPEDRQQAETYYNLCLDHDPNHEDCYRGLAVLLVEEQKSEAAFRLLEGWSERNPTSPGPKIELARLTKEFGNKDLAKSHLLDAIAADPHDPRALTAMGQLNEEMGNSDQALANYQRSLMNNNFQPEVAARIAALRSAGGPTSLTMPSGGTQTVNSATTTLR
jgi:tetratricopeptide (TPR) repeat protein